MAKETRGIRNCNPGNIRKGCNWKGLRCFQKDPDFCQFTHMLWGLRALCVTLRTYVRVHKRKNVSLIIQRWAPPEDHNNTVAYIDRCAKGIGNEICHDALTLEREKRDTGLNYEFTMADFALKDGKPSDAMYGLVKTMCLVESGYKLSRLELAAAIKAM